MQRWRKSSWLCGLSLIGLSAPALAMAQDAGPTEPDRLAPEIVVTAQKRSENVQDVPISVSVVGAEQIATQNITTTSDLVRAVPALTVTNFGAFQVRSIGTQGFGKSAEQSVSVVVDGVAMPRPLAYQLANSIFDLDHVEVLSGPQGTLFGKNATAGVINIVTKAPRLGEFEGGVHLDVGNHDVVNLEGVLNIPIGDKAALRVVGHHNATGNIVYNTLFRKWDHNEDNGVRARLLWEPTETLRINLFADYQHLSSNGVNGMADFSGVDVFTYVPPGSPLEATLAGCGITAGPRNNKVCGDSLYDPDVDVGDVYGAHRGGASAQIDWDFADGYTFTSISAYRHHVTGDFDVDGDFAGGQGDTLPLNIRQRNLFPSSLKMFSQEARIQSPPTDRINFVAGLYYSRLRTHDHIDQAGRRGNNTLLPGQELRRVNDVYSTAINYAAFGQVNFDVTPELRLLAGGRVTRDKLRTFSSNSFPDAAPTGPYVYQGNTGGFSLFPINTCTLAGGNPDIPASCPAGTSLDEAAVITETGYTWKLGAQYRFNPRTMVYATVTRGYKGPFINDQATWPIAPSEIVVKSEKPTAFEVGLKATVFDRMNLSVAAFHNKIKNFQTTIFVPPVPPSITSSFKQGNAPYAISRGVDISLFGNVTRNLSLNASLLYNEAYFNKGFVVPCVAGPCPARRQLPFAPKWKATLSGEYRYDVSDKVQAFVQSDLTYSSGFPYSSSPEQLESGSRYLVGGRIGLRLDDEKYGVSFFCRNCFDKRYPTIVQPDLNRSADGGAGPTPATSALTQFLNLGSYRVVGLSLDARF